MVETNVVKVYQNTAPISIYRGAPNKIPPVPVAYRCPTVLRRVAGNHDYYNTLETAMIGNLPVSGAGSIRRSLHFSYMYRMAPNENRGSRLRTPYAGPVYWPPTKQKEGISGKSLLFEFGWAGDHNNHGRRIITSILTVPRC